MWIPLLSVAMFQPLKHQPDDEDLVFYVSFIAQYLRHIEMFVLKFYGPVNPMGSCRARSVYLTTFTGQA